MKTKFWSNSFEKTWIRRYLLSRLQLADVFREELKPADVHNLLAEPVEFWTKRKVQSGVNWRVFERWCPRSGDFIWLGKYGSFRIWPWSFRLSAATVPRLVQAMDKRRQRTILQTVGRRRTANRNLFQRQKSSSFTINIVFIGFFHVALFFPSLISLYIMKFL